MSEQPDIEIRPIDGSDAAALTRLSQLASAIVKQHYDPIIGAEQNDYMIAMFQSPSAIAEQISHGYRYYEVFYGNTLIGFMAFYPRDGKMYLSKLYLHKDYRGKGFSHKMIDFVRREAVKDGFSAIFLNVNKGNSDSIAAYHHLGFVKVREETNDIGHGFVMDDYVLEYAW